MPNPYAWRNTFETTLYQHMSKVYYEGARMMRDAGFLAHAIRLQNEACAAAFMARHLVDITPALKKALHNGN